MTYEQYDKAVQIKEDMNVIYALQDVFGSAKNGNFLSAIKVEKWDSSGRIVEHCNVFNHAEIPEHIMKRFERILWEELDILKEEFKKL